MTRIAHISDTHIRNLRYHKEYRTVFATLFERLKKEKVDYIIHCGDIAHSKTHISPEFVKLCSEFLIGLSAAAPTYIILGNHDGNLKNSSREDAISPIVNALNLPNLFLLKNSGERLIDKEICLNVLSVFDRDGWAMPSSHDRINIALYHGSISNCETDLGWVMEHGENDIKIFAGHDFALLGDIHKTNQVLDPEGRIRYPGSTVQQNFGETDDKGFLIWDIYSKNDFTVKHISIPNPKPFVTIKLTKAGRLPKKVKCPIGARIRLVSENNIPLQTMKRVLEIAQHRFKPERVTYLNRSAGDRGNVGQCINNLSVDNLRDISVQETLIEEYLKDYNLTEEQLENVFKLNKKYNTVVEDSEEVQRNVNWKLSRVDWDNLFNYGEGNSINLQKLNGIIGIFGKNYSGKSSVVDSLLYALFNSTSKNERKNLNVINQNKQDASGQAIITIGDKEYCVHRTSEKYVKKLKGEEILEAKTNVNFTVKDLVTDEVTELNGTTRNETDRIIRSHFGTLDDFLLTSMSSQTGALQFISEGSTKRKEILAKFLDLEMLDQKFKLAKDDATDLRGALRRTEDVNHDDEIYETEKQLMHLENTSANQNQLCDKLAGELEELNKNVSIIQAKIDSLPTEIINIKQVQEQILAEENNTQTYRGNIVNCGRILADNNKVLKKIRELEVTFDVGECKERQEKINQLFAELDIIDRDLEKANNLVYVNDKKIRLLNEVPCGTEYPTCKFIKDAHTAESGSFDLKKIVEGLQENRLDKNIQIASFNQEQIERHIKQYEQVKQKKTTYEKSSLKTDLEKGKWENAILVSEKELEGLIAKERQYNENKELIDNKGLFTKQLAKETKVYLEKEKERNECQNALLECYKKNGSLEQKLKSLNEKKQNLIDLQEEYSAYDLFMRCMHSNGIAYDVIKKKLPTINDEIGKILANVVDFEVFFEADDKKLNIFIKHPHHDERPIEMGSGAEKTLAAMAIRLALLSVSSLPKSDVFILDEPGTALDVENMDGFISILELIKTYFKTVILISHLDNLKDCVDQQIVIDKKDGFAHISI